MIIGRLARGYCKKKLGCYNFFSCFFLKGSATGKNAIKLSALKLRVTDDIETNTFRISLLD